MTGGGFTKVPNALAFDVRLSFGARSTYSALLHLAWRAGRRKQDDPAELPPLDECAVAVGCSKTALKGYIAELKKLGWVATARKARQQPQVYWVLDVPDLDFVGRIPAHESTVRGSDSGPRNVSHAFSPSPKENDGASAPSVGAAPDLVKVDGQNLGWNALAEVCAINPGSNREGEIRAALFGSVRAGLAHGIRHMVWQELVKVRFHGDVQAARDAVAEDPARFEAAIATLIVRRARLYRDNVLPRGGILTGPGLAKYWLDLEGLGRSSGALTPDDLLAMAGQAS